MAKISFMAASLLLLGFFICGLDITGAQSIGVCNGRVADNLPSEQDVVNFYVSNRIAKMRIYDPNQATLQALASTNIELTLDVPNDALQSLTDPSAAATWVQTNVLAFSPGVNFRYIAVGNEVHPGDAEAQYVLPAMQNIHSAILSANLQDQIKVSTAIDTSLLGNSFPPSAGSFSDTSSPYIDPIVQFLSSTGAPLLANVYPYFAYIGDPTSIRLDYAIFTAPNGTVIDGPLQYQNLFDAMLDALNSAVEAIGFPNVGIVVSETGWPSEGGFGASFDNANTYYKNLIDHVKIGTPKKPGQAIETFLFAMFDEDNKPGAETERHFGLFTPDKTPKYQLVFTS